MIARFFIDRPIFATVLSLVITLIGGIALYSLPIAQYPRITPPGISITINYPGASAPVVADTVAAPIEQQVNGIEGMLYMSSQMGNDGSYTLTVTFDIGTDVNTALVMVQNRVALALPQLPTSVQSQGITIRKRTPDMLMIVNFFSPDGRYDDIYLSNFATIYVKDELLRVYGVSDVNYMGQRDYSIRAWLNPQKLASYNMTAMDVAAAIRTQNLDAPSGQIGQPPSSLGQPFQMPVNTLGRLTDPEQFGAIVVKTGTVGPREPATAITRLRDVARIELGAQNYNQACTFDRHKAVGLSIYQLPGTNALDVGDRVRAKMEELKTRFPDGVDYDIGYDTTPFIRESVGEVFKTLRDAVILVGIVVLVFLQDWRAMILPMIDVPVSLIGTFAVMAAMGFSLNNLTLFGLVLAIGIVVDDAIVVLENTERLIATGLDARSATIKAMDEITGPILAITLALCSVFIPCCFIGGITGQFFRQFAVTIAVSTVISAINAMTMTPSRAVLIFRTEEGSDGHTHKKEALPWWIFGVLGGFLTVRLGEQWLGDKPFALPAMGMSEESLAAWLPWVVKAAYFTPGALAGGLLGWLIIRPVNAVLAWLFGGFNALFDGVSSAYGWTVGKSLRISAVVLFAYAGLLGLTVFVFQRAPTGFIPQQDQGRLIVNVQLPDSASLQRTQEAMAEIEAIAHEVPGVAHTVTISGMSFLAQSTSSSFASMFIVLDPFDKRKVPGRDAESIMARLRKAYNRRVKDARVTVYGSSPIPGLGVAGGFKIIVEDRGSLGLQALQTQTDELTRKLNALPAMASATTQFRSRSPQLFLDIDRTKVESLGVTFQDVNQTLSMYLGSLYVNSFNEFGRHWQVTIQVEGQYRNQIEDIGLLKVRNKWGQMVPIGTLVTLKEIGGPIAVQRYNLYTGAAITGSLKPGVSTGDAIAAINKLASDSLPLSMRTEWTELMFVQIRAGNTALYVFALAAVSVFLALAALYESWTLPLAVILVVPLCLLCSVWGVLYTGRDVNIFVQIGLVVLVGLACKNAILIVEFAKQLQQEGRSRQEATREACRLRLRPILMTSLAFIFGVIPLVVAAGAGAEMRRSLGIAVFTGMVGVTLFGIFLTPVFYSVIQGLSTGRLFAGNAARWVGSTLASGLLGLGVGCLLAQLGVVRLTWGLGIGGAAGMLAPLLVLSIHTVVARATSPPDKREDPFV
ncbi:MAG: efflux RND transporter permease subunit [Isosphaeraceae bacterium]|nr:efflux RND transporter permease subunit [Isosphaeraceae bacterium]